MEGNVPRDWPGFDFDPATGTTTTTPSSSSSSSNKRSGVEIGIMVAIILVCVVLVALVVLLVVRKRSKMSQKPAAAQNAARDPAEALKLDADGSVLQEVMASMSRTPGSTASGNGSYRDYETDDPESVEVERPKTPVGPYSDNPYRLNGRNENGNRYDSGVL